MKPPVVIHGDCLAAMREMPDGSADLIYADPPFCSRRTHRDREGEFADSWMITGETEAERREIAKARPSVGSIVNVAEVVAGQEMAAYLSLLANRLWEMHRLLSERGSLYVHCDDSAGHWIRALLDAICGAGRFRAEITWKRNEGHPMAARRWGRIADRIICYARGEATFNRVYAPHDPAYVAAFYTHDDGDGRGRYRKSDISANGDAPGRRFVWQGYAPPENGWAYSADRMDAMHAEGRLALPLKPDGSPDFEKRVAKKTYLAELPGQLIANVWTDLPKVAAAAAENAGYPTQKPLALLERIVSASSREGDHVLDPFCGSGTTLAAAVKLGRRSTGIDASADAVRVARARLETAPDGDAETEAVADG